ncbi:hypothetical protein BDW74DRAFT_185117 [Aspergillus multicolor]|uniref:Zn(II)2Cys6 transcription factor domain-containing protein n=1 Tax=Aspergillus multicolor TaxID=41759 RepID=UPI003CCE2926
MSRSQPRFERERKISARACTNCVRAKARCAFPSPQGKCERCTRMNKECHPSPPARKRQATTNRITKNTQVQQLEEKVEGLAFMLRSTISRSPVNSTSGSISATGLWCVGQSQSTISTCLVATSPFEPEPAEAERCLNWFRTHMLGSLPFLVLSSSITAEQLRQERPLLWLSIMTVACTRPAQQQALSKETREIFGREAYIEGRRSLDFLWAVLVFVSWDQWHSYGRCPSTSLTQLAISIVYDLALDKPAPPDPGLSLMLDVKGMNNPPVAHSAPSLDEQRAVMGCFLVSTVRSLQGKGESLKWTPTLDKYQRTIEQHNEAPSDPLLAQLVKLRLLADAATTYLTTSASDPSSLSQPDASAHFRSLQSQLRALNQSIPTHLLTHNVLQLELHNTEATINQIGFLPSPFFFEPLNNRFQCLYGCLQSVKSWITVFHSIPAAEYPGFSVLMRHSMIRAFSNICRLAICNHVEWDRSLLAATIDVSAMLDETCKRYSQVRGTMGPDAIGTARNQEATVYDLMAEKLRGMKACWDSMTATATAQEDSLLEPGLGTGFLDDLGSFSEEFLGLWDWT